MRISPLVLGLFLTVSALFSLGAAERVDPMKLSREDFFRIVRQAPGTESWARMIGTAMHKREGSRMVKAPIRLGIRFTPARIVAQLVFNNDEFYNLGQAFAPPVSSQEIFLKGKSAQLPVFGISASDLTLGFLYQDVIAEEKPDSVRTLSCRVFVMNSTAPGEFARVWISADYFFPLKVQWFKSDPSADPKVPYYRMLEIESVKKEHDFWVIPSLEMSGPDWRTRISFDDRSAGHARDGVPKDLFLEP